MYAHSHMHTSSNTSLTPWDKILHTVRVSTEASHVHREHAPSPTLQDVGTVGDEGLGDRGVAVTSSGVEGSVPTLVLNLNTGTCMYILYIVHVHDYVHVSLRKRTILCNCAQNLHLYIPEALSKRY